MWKQLVEIKRLREREAAKTRREADDRRARAQAAFHQAEAALARQRTEAAESERAGYAQLFSAPVRPRAFEELHINLAQMHQHTQARQAEVDSTSHALAEARAAAGQAHVVHVGAQRVCEKFDELLEMHVQEAIAHAQWLEDAEMEESASSSLGRGAF